MVKGAGLLLFAVILDILQAGISASLLALGSIGGAVGIPLALAVGFAINICLSLTFGSLLTGLIWLAGFKHPWLLISGYLGEIIPGVDNLPGWTLLVLAALWKGARDKKSTTARKGILRIAGAALPGAQAVMNLKGAAAPAFARSGIPSRTTPTPQTGTRLALIQHQFEGIKSYKTHAKAA